MGKTKPKDKKGTDTPGDEGDNKVDLTHPSGGYSEEFIAHQFKPGKSGNPAGRPRGRSITDKLQKILDEADPANPHMSVQERLIRETIKYASRGDARFMTEVFNRTEGKVPDRILGSIGLGPLDGMDLKKLKKIIAAAEKAGK